METVEKSALRSLFWKDEILQVLYWMQGEGLGEQVSMVQILSLLNTNEDNLRFHLKKLSVDGVLIASDPQIADDTLIRLSPKMYKEAGKRFSSAFQGYQKTGHGECGPDCEFCYDADGQKLDNCVHNCATANE